jgi:hypothetical protein
MADDVDIVWAASIIKALGKPKKADIIRPP